MRPYTIKEYRVTTLSETAPVDYLCDTPDKAAKLYEEQLQSHDYVRQDVETMIVLHTNTRRRVTGWEILSNGTLDTLLVHPREVFRGAIVANAGAIIVMHNHPSGDPTPSEADIRVTRDLLRAGQLLKIDLLDHVIMGRLLEGWSKSWTSLRELGYLYS